MGYFLSILSIFLLGVQEKGWAKDICSSKRTNLVLNKEMNISMSYCVIYLNDQLAGGYSLGPESTVNSVILDDNCSCNVVSAQKTISKYQEDKKPFYANVSPERIKDIDFLKLIKSLTRVPSQKNNYNFEKKDPTMHFNQEKKICEYFQGDRLIGSRKASDRTECLASIWVELFNAGKCFTEVVGHTNFQELSSKNVTVCRRKKDAWQEIVATNSDEACLQLDCDSSFQDKILFKGENTCQVFAIKVTEKEQKSRQWNVSEEEKQKQEKKLSEEEKQKQKEEQEKKLALYLCRNYVESTGLEKYFLVEKVKDCDEWCKLTPTAPRQAFDSHLSKEVESKASSSSSAPSSPAKSKKK